MYDIPDNELDDLIKRSLTEQDSPMDPRAWKAMESLLDKEDRKPLFYYFILSGIVAFVLLSGTALFFYQNKLNNQSLATNNISNKANPDADKLHATDESSEATLSGNNNIVTTKKTNSNTLLKNNAETNYLEIKTNTVISNNSDISNRSIINKNTTSIISQKENYRNNIFSPLDKLIDYSDDNNNINEYSNNKINEENNKDPDNAYKKEETQQLALIKDDSLSEKIILPLKDSIDTKSEVAKKEAKSEKSNKLKVSINLVTGPDFSTTKDFDFYKSGFNTGLLTEIYFSKRLSFIVGAIYGKKIYVTEGYDYKTGDNFWPTATRPEEVKANCSVLDIPINLRYKPFIRDRYNFFISAGLSSYFMMKEKYNYDYEINQPGLLQSWQVRYKNFHALKICNVSFGYERYFGKDLSLQIEPYAKIPLSGVGYGKIKLISTGISFSLKYFLR